MNTIKLTYFNTEVRKVFDEIGVNEASFLTEDIDSSNMDTEISGKVLEAVRYVHQNASIERLYDANSITPISTISDSGKAIIDLDSKFMKIVKLKFSDWTFPIFGHISEFSPEYHKQEDKYACGTPERPLAFLVKSTNGLTLECYSVKSNSATIETMLWLPEPEIINNTDISICALCSRAIVYRIAGLTLENYNDTDKAKVCFDFCELNMK